MSPGSTDENLPLLKIPKHKAAFNVDYSFTKSLNADLEAIFVGKRDDKYFANYTSERVTLDGYTLINFSATFRLLQNFTLYGRLVNLLNADYEEVYGYGTAKRSGYIGLKISFE